MMPRNAAAVTREEKGRCGKSGSLAFDTRAWMVGLSSQAHSYICGCAGRQESNPDMDTEIESKEKKELLGNSLSQHESRKFKSSSLLAQEPLGLDLQSMPPQNKVLAMNANISCRCALLRPGVASGVRNSRNYGPWAKKEFSRVRQPVNSSQAYLGAPSSSLLKAMLPCCYLRYCLGATFPEARILVSWERTKYLHLFYQLIV